ncbi:hypothetical protein WB391_24815, partial [Lusitaniella coriacea LEGE 07167]
MSHFSAIQTQLIDKEALVRGLQSLLEQHQIAASLEIHEEAVELHSDYDRADTAFAHLVLRRHSLGAMLDLGFLQTEQGTFEAQVDEWDFSRAAHLLGQAFGTVRAFLELVQLSHDTAYIQIHYPPERWDYRTQT